MQYSLDEIERVVREVLSEMKRTPTTVMAPPAAPPIPPPQPAPAPGPTGKKTTFGENGVLVLNQRVVTLAEVSGRLAGKRRVVVRPGTVVTPAVRDALRQRNLPLEFSAPTVPLLAPARLILFAARTQCDPKPLAANLRSTGLNVGCQSGDCVIAAADHLAAELANRDALGVMITPHAAAALCLANRLPGVRAILGADLSSLPEDAGAVGANVLILNPKKFSIVQLRQMIEQFCAGGVRPCPEALGKQLS
jgi:hypothetical protein